jgi:glycine betaine/proline transport system substrate-binding protein
LESPGIDWQSGPVLLLLNADGFRIEEASSREWRAMAARRLRMVVLLVTLLAAPTATAQITVLDQAQDASAAAASEPAAAPPPCGAQPVSIARMSWPSAELLAEIHARILAREYGCQIRITPGDLAASVSAMGSTGQPAVVPEMWVGRVAEVWNGAIEARMLRPAASSYMERQLEGWFLPAPVAAAYPQLQGIADLAAVLPALKAGAPVRFISCPADWACAVINRNLIKALNIGNLVELVEPANRLAMDRLIAEAVNRKEPVLFYYWQPNAVLAQLDFVPLDMGAYDGEAAKCLGQLSCTSPVPSAFVEETVVVALAEWVFTDIPAIAAYFQRASMPLGEMNQLLAQLSEPGASVERVAEGFVAEKEVVWRDWVGAGLP